MLLWGIAVIPSPLRGALGVISGGAFVAGGIILITLLFDRSSAPVLNTGWGRSEACTGIRRNWAAAGSPTAVGAEGMTVIFRSGDAQPSDAVDFQRLLPLEKLFG